MIKVVVSYIKAAVDVVLDYNSKNKRFGQDASESVTVSDTPQITTAYTRTAEDAVTVAEQIILNTQFNLEFTETLSSTDTFNGWSLDKAIDDSITTGDTPGIGAIHKVSPTDSVTAGDTPGIGAIHVVTPSDSISVSDSKSVFYDGMLGTNMLNTRLISAGDTEITGTNVTIT